MTTEAGRRLLRAMHSEGLFEDELLAEALAEARAALLAELEAGVEGMIEAAGGRCVLPADYDPGELNICEAHSELIDDEGCEDQPRQLLAVLDLIRKEREK